MTKTIGTLVVLISLSTALSAQVFCLDIAEFNYHEIYKRAGLDSSVEVIFDVEAYTPKNFRIKILDLPTNYSGTDELIAITKKNFMKQDYIRNGKNIRYIVNYVVNEGNKVSNDYIELENDTTLNVRFCSFLYRYRSEHGPGSIILKDEKPDTSIICRTLPFQHGLAEKSDMLVQKFFKGDKEEIVIINNNNQILERKILADAKKVDRWQFNGFSRYFFIRYKIKYEVRSCHFSTTF